MTALTPPPIVADAVTLRPVHAGDSELLYAIYASTRARELAQVGWDDAQKESFLRMQFDAQSSFYESGYPGAELQVILIAGEPAGRLYVHRREKEIRIMDIALLPEFCGRGIGTKLLNEVLAEGERTARPVTIHVESFNPARRLYERLGFAKIGDNGVYHLLEKSWANRSRAKVLPFLLLLTALLCLPLAPSARAQNLGATMTTSLVATQGETLTYTVVITNRTSNAITGVTLSDALDPHTTLVSGSIGMSPLAIADTYSALGNVQISIAAPGVLANDMDLDGVGPALTVTAANTISANGGNVAIAANGGFTYNPPRGFEGTDTFTYTLNDGEGFTDRGTVSVSVLGMIWFVNAAAPAGGDGRLTSPLNSLAALAAINNGFETNAAPGDSFFLYSGAYVGPLRLFNDQKLLGQGAGASIASIMGLNPPAGSLALPATGGARPTITSVGISGGITLASNNVVRGLNLANDGGNTLSGGNVGAFTMVEASITNLSGMAAILTGGTLNVRLGSVTAAGGGIRLVNCTGSFSVTGDGVLAQNGTGGTINGATAAGIHLDGAVNVSLARMNVVNCQAGGLFGVNVHGLVIDWCRFDNNADQVEEAGIRLNGLTGTAPGGANPTRLANTLVRASGEMNVAIFNSAGALAQLEVTNVVCKDTRARPLGADGFYFETRGSAVATVNFTSCSFSNNFTQGIQASALGQSVLSVTVTNCGFTNNNEGVVLANANDADLVFDIAGNRFFNNLAAGASGSAVAAVNATTVTSAALYSGKVRSNTIIGGGIDNHLVAALLAGAGNNTLHVANNNINAVNAQFSGIFVQAGETGSGNLNANLTLTGNTVSVGALGSHGIAVQSRIASALCAEIANNASTTAGIGLFGVNVRQRDTSTFRLPGYAGGPADVAAVRAFLQSKNAGSTMGATVATAYSGGAACVLPLLAMPTALNPDPDPALAPPPPPPNPNPNLASIARYDPEFSSKSVSVSASDSESRSENDDRTGLTSTRLASILAAARQRWADTGLASEQLAIIDSLRFEIADLAGWYLGASSGRVVQLDRRATGYGWFIDPTPNDDEEYAGQPPANASTPSERIDLLTAVLHEMGHNLGLADDYTPAARDDVMYGFLAPGERRLPVPGQALNAVPGTGSEVHYMFAPLNLGTLPAGKSVTITFRVTVTNTMPPGVCTISNQATVTAGGGISVLTDDPRTAAPLDATLTLVRARPSPVTLAASAVTATSVQFNGIVNPGGAETLYYFHHLTSGEAVAGNVLPPLCEPLPVSGFHGGLVPNSVHSYRLFASNSVGMTIGNTISFTTLPPSFIEQPNDALVCAGKVATFSVAVAGQTFGRFQWQRRNPGVTAFQDIDDGTDATNATYRTPPVTSADHGAAFRVVFSIVSIAGLTLITSEEAVLSVNRLSDPAVFYDFNSGLPPNTASYGSAYVDAGTGVLELNPNGGDLSGAFLTADLVPGRSVRGFAATFRARLQEGSFPPADGFSFNWASDLPNGIYAIAEEGAGSGLRVCFDTWDNGPAGTPEAPAIDVWWGPNLIARQAVSIPFLVRGPDFFDVHIRLSEGGLLDVTYACQPIFNRLPIPGYAPQVGARFGLGSRTGGAWETHGIDDLGIDLYLDPTNRLPQITRITTQSPSGVLITGTGVPGENYTIEASTDLVTWTWRGTLAADAAGVWQFFEPNIAATEHRFYRVQAAPQFPSGLVTWYRAEGNQLDSFGPHHGSAFGVEPDFAAGNRGLAFSFNGTSQAMLIGGADIPPPWTAAFWVNRQDAVETSAALLTSPSAGLKLEQWPSTRQVGFTAFGVADYSFSYIAPLNTWTHLTFVGTAAGTTLHVNGIEFQTIGAGINLPMNLLGSRENNVDHLQGQIDETVLFNRALAPAEIQQVLNATRGP